MQKENISLLDKSKDTMFKITEGEQGDKWAEDIQFLKVSF